MTYTEVKDPYRHLRSPLFNNCELDVKLIGKTVLQRDAGGDLAPDCVPGMVARMSHGSEGTDEADIRLTKNLLKMSPMPHDTPFEFMQWIFRITGVTKSCLTQFDRHRIGVGFVQMSSRYMSKANSGFVYNTYDYVTEEQARTMLEADAAFNRLSLEQYNLRRSQGATKQDARKLLPLSMATGTFVYLNSRSIRHFFKLRLDSHAEWEIRRMAKALWDIVYPLAPAHFQDLLENP